MRHETRLFAATTAVWMCICLAAGTAAGAGEWGIVFYLATALAFLAFERRSRSRPNAPLQPRDASAAK